jgi:hypothetical protein
MDNRRVTQQSFVSHSGGLVNVSAVEEQKNKGTKEQNSSPTTTVADSSASVADGTN